MISNTRCPHCKLKGEIDDEWVGEIIECPGCGQDFKAKRLVKRPKPEAAPEPEPERAPAKAVAARQGNRRIKTTKRTPAATRTASRPAGVAATATMRQPRARTLLALLLIWFNALCCLLAGLGGLALAFDMSSEDAGVSFFVYLAGIALFLGSAFAAVAIGVHRRRRWGLRYGRGVVACMITTPLFPIAVLALRGLGHDETEAAFGIAPE